MADDDIEFDNLDEAESLLSSVETSQEAPGRFVARTIAEVAEFFGLALQTCKEWRSAAPPMPGEPGNYPLPEIVRWRLNKLSHNETSDELRAEQVQKLRVQTESARIDLEKLKASVLDRADVELWASVALTEIREGIMQLPEMLTASAPQDLKDFVRSETERHCRDTLTALARRLDVMEVVASGEND